MKVFILLILSGIFFISCGHKQETKLQAFNAEAFAFQVDNGWEVNASVRVKGFRQNTVNETFSGRISYSVGIITPAKDTVKNLAADIIHKSQKEEFTDLPVEVQIDLDSTYLAGKYQVLFNVKDELSGMNTSAVKELELE